MVAVASGGHRRAWPRSRPPASCPRTTRAPCSSSRNCLAARRSRGPPKSSSQAEAILKEEEAVARLHLGDRVELHRQLLAVKRRLHGRHAQAVRGAQGPLARRAGAHRALGAEVPPDSGRHGRSAGAAADPRPRHRRRLRLRAAGPARRRSQGARSGAARAHGRRQPGPASSTACSARSRRPIPRSISTSTATRRRSSACRSSDVFQALQASLGGYYVNNMNLFGRTWQVQVQAEGDRSRQHR